MSRKIAVVIVCLITFAVLAVNAGAESAYAYSAPYMTWTSGPEGDEVATQTAYIPSVKIAVTTAESSVGALKNPEDMCINGDTLFIADTGNKRIAVFIDYAFAFDFGADVLNAPTGIAADGDYIYVADKGNAKVYVFQSLYAEGVLSDYALVREIGKPDSVLVGATTPFVPLKITANGKSIYIVSEGCVNGLMQLSVEGDFIGYTGANQTQTTFRQVIQRLFYSKEQRNTFLATPRSPTFVTSNSVGLLYTVTTGASTESIRKLNTLGNAVLSPSLNREKTVALCVDEADNMYGVTDDGIVTVYDSYGDALFWFGGRDNLERFGTLKNPTAIAVYGGNVIVLDKEYGFAVVYARTDFAELVFDAVAYYKDGLYIEGEQSWQNVLEANSFFILSYNALAKANMKRGEYALALEQFEKAENKDGYSEAYWQVRNDWLRNYLGIAIIIVLAVAAASIAVKVVDKHKYPLLNPLRKVKAAVLGISVFEQLNHLERFLTHPTVAVYEIKYHNKGSVLSAALLYVWYIVLQVLSVVVKGFLFSDVSFYTQSALRIVLSTLPLLLIVVCNYFVSTVSDGEGKLKHCFIVFAYSLAPYLIFALPLFVLSNVITYNESVIYNGLNFIIIGWTAITMFLSIMELHDYTFWGTVKNILLTTFALLMLALFLIILRLLFMQMFNYFAELIREIVI
ncbi:MAG: hypothetical protein PHX51_05245 [Clostridia bacterium]|nr:hypothetical protein [Clostridia bacterium]